MTENENTTARKSRRYRRGPEEIPDTNTIRISGSVKSKEEAYRYKYPEEVFYKLMVEVSRLSETTDTLPIIVSEKLLYDIDIEPETLVYIEGQIRSRSYIVHKEGEEDRRFLDIFGYATEIHPLSIKEYMDQRAMNEVELTGRICRQPRNRKTERTARSITDIYLSVGRFNGIEDYRDAA